MRQFSASDRRGVPIVAMDECRVGPGAIGDDGVIRKTSFSPATMALTSISLSHAGGEISFRNRRAGPLPIPCELPSERGLSCAAALAKSIRRS